jgi:hypothetical protein
MVTLGMAATSWLCASERAVWSFPAVEMKRKAVFHRIPANPAQRERSEEAPGTRAGRTTLRMVDRGAALLWTTAREDDLTKRTVKSSYADLGLEMSAAVEPWSWNKHPA